MKTTAIVFVIAILVMPGVAFAELVHQPEFEAILKRQQESHDKWVEIKAMEVAFIDSELAANRPHPFTGMKTYHYHLEAHRACDNLFPVLEQAMEVSLRLGVGATCPLMVKDFRNDGYREFKQHCDAFKRKQAPFPVASKMGAAGSKVIHLSTMMLAECEYGSIDSLEKALKELEASGL